MRLDAWHRHSIPVAPASPRTADPRPPARLDPAEEKDTTGDAATARSTGGSTPSIAGEAAKRSKVRRDNATRWERASLRRPSGDPPVTRGQVSGSVWMKKTQNRIRFVLNL